MVVTLACHDVGEPDGSVLGPTQWREDADVAFAGDATVADGVWVARADDMGATATLLLEVDGPGGLAWSPCGDELAIHPHSRRGFVTVGVAATREYGLRSGAGHVTPRAFAWSPGGEAIAVLGEPGSDQGIGLRCGDARSALLLCTPEHPACESLASATGPSVGRPSWSPTGWRIAYVAAEVACDGGPEADAIGLPPSARVHDVRGGVAVTMPPPDGRVDAVAWSPTDARIAVVVDRGLGADLVVWNVEDGTVTAVTSVEQAIDGVEWFSDGTRWLVALDTDPPSVVTYDARTGAEQRRWSGYGEPRLAPDDARVIAIEAATGAPVVLDLLAGSARPAIGSEHAWRPRCDDAR